MKQILISILASLALFSAGCGSSSNNVPGQTSASKAITAFSFSSPAVDGTIDENNHTIAITVPYGTNVTALVATFTTTGASVKVGSIDQISGTTANDYTNPLSTPVTYTVTALDNTTEDYTVTVTVAPATAKAITAFSFTNPSAIGDVNESNHTIAITVPYGTIVTALAAVFTTDGASVKIESTDQESGTTENDFTSSKTYTVTAADNSTQDYIVTVTVADGSAKDIKSFSLLGVDGVIEGTNISVTLPYGTAVTGLAATFTTDGASVKIGLIDQVSGTTTNNFTNPVTYIVTAADNTTKNYIVTVTFSLNPAKAITSFSFTSPAATGVVTDGTHKIAITVPFGTDLTGLVATFITTGASVKIDSTVQVSGATANDFSNPATYTVTADNGTTQTYEVTVSTALNTAKAITSFDFTSPAATGVITSGNHTIAITVPSGTDVTALAPVIAHSGAGINPGSGEAQDFTAPVNYTVTASDSSIQVYTVTVTKALSSVKDITAFSLSGVDGIFDGSSISVTLPYGTIITALKASFTTTGSSIQVGSTSQITGVTPNNFTSPVVYTVTAADSTTKNYTVTVTIALNTEKAITAYNFISPIVSGVITEGTHTIAITVPSGTTVTNLIAAFSTSPGASVKIGTTSQVSGTTGNNFTSPVTYRVTAADSSFQDYVVTVSLTTTTNAIIPEQENIPGSTIDTPPFTAAQELWLAPNGINIGDTSAFTEGNTMTANFDPATLAIRVPLTPGQYYLYKIVKDTKVVLEKSLTFLTVLGEVSRSMYNGEMYMPYADGVNSDKITVKKYSFTTSTWTTVGTAGFTTNGTNWSYPPGYQLSVDQSNGRLYMVHQENTGWDGQGKLYEYNGTSWSLVWTNAYATFFPNLYITLDGTKYIFYKDNSSGWGICLTQITKAGVVSKINLSSYDAGYGTAMFVENGILYIAFTNNIPANDFKLSVIKYDTSTTFAASSVSLVGAAKFTPDYGYSPALYVTDGTPYVAYSDNANNKKLSVMKYDGASWIQVGTAGITTNAITSFQAAYDFTDYSSSDLTKHCYVSTAICANGTNVYVTAEDKTTMQASIYKYNGTSWSVLKSNYALKTVEPTITYDNGQLTIVYKNIDKTGMQIYTCSAN